MKAPRSYLRLPWPISTRRSWSPSVSTAPHAVLPPWRTDKPGSRPRASTSGRESMVRCDARHGRYHHDQTP